MTTILFSGLAVPVEVTYDQPGLNVAMKISKWNGAGWTVVGSPVAAPNTGTGSNTYGCLYAPPDNGAYIVELAVYTDNTFATYQDGYFASSRSFIIDPFIIVPINNSIFNPPFGIHAEVADNQIVAAVLSNP